MRILSLTVLCITLGFSVSTNCYSQVATKDKHYLSAGYGFAPIEIRKGNGYYGNGASWVINTFGPLYFKYEYFFEYNLSLGFNYAHAVYEFNYDVSYYDYSTGTYNYFRQTETHTSQSYLVRLNYHILDYEEKFRWDPYIGVGLGYRETSVKVLHTDNSNYYYGYYIDYPYVSNMKFGMEVTFGLRCFLTPKLALYAEGGMAKSAFQLGTTYSF